MNTRIVLAIALALLGCLSGFTPAHATRIDAFTFFIPYPSDALDDQFDAAHHTSFKGTDIATTISISVLRDGSMIYYDHWEDGLERNITYPTQTSTQVWGPLSAGDVIPLQNTVPVEPRDRDLVLFDGGDKIVSVGGAVAVILAVWPETVPHPGTGDPISGILFAGAWELYPTSRWGTHYVISVGQDVVRAEGSFRVVGVNVQALKDDTSVDFDLDADGHFEITGFGLDEGEHFNRVRGVNAGAEVRASAPVQVHVFTGNPINSYEARAYTMLPRDQWTNDYLAPRSSGGDYWLYNPHDDDLLVSAQTISASESITVPAKSVAKYPPQGLSAATGVRFTSIDEFYGVVALDDTDDQDWGYPLLPIERLTTQALVGWAPSDHNDPPGPPGDPDPDESRLYVTAIDQTTLAVDYDGDGTRDAAYAVAPLAEVDITDPSDRDMTGARVYTENGVPFMAVWGQYQDAPRSLPSIDVGTNIVPLRAPSIQKTCYPIELGYNCGTVIRPWTIRFQLLAYNDAANDFFDVIVKDTLSPGVTYLPGSTTVDGSPIPDDSGGSPFPLDEGGYNVGTIPGFGKVSITFEAEIATNGVYINRAELVSHPTDPAIVELSLPCRVSGYQVSKSLTDPPAGPVDSGQAITYTLTITNTGDVPITLLPLADEFDQNCLTFQSASLAPDVVAPGKVRWEDLTDAFGGELAPDGLFDLSVSFTVDNIPPGMDSTANIILAEGVQDSITRTQAIMCGEAMVALITPTPPPDNGNGDDGTETPEPPVVTTTTAPPLAPTPAVTFLPETGGGYAPALRFWPWVVLPGLGLLAAWAAYRHKT